MTLSSYPKVGGTTTDAQYAAFFASFIGTGVRDAGSFLVTADSSGLNVKVAPGFAVVAGNVATDPAQATLTIAANASGNPRIDTVILKRDFTAGNVVSLVVKAGTPAASPSAPSLTQDVTAVWEEPLANVYVANNAATITSANVTDVRRFMPTNVASWLTGGRPAARLALVGLNLTTGRWEGHDGTEWVELLDSRQIVISPTPPASPKPNQIHMY